MRGGYKIIDLQNVNFTIDEPQTIAGIYNAVESSHRKPILISNFVLSGVEKPDRYCTLRLDNSAYVGSIAVSTDGDVLSIEITDSDTITISTT